MEFVPITKKSVYKTLLTLHALSSMNGNFNSFIKCSVVFEFEEMKKLIIKHVNCKFKSQQIGTFINECGQKELKDIIVLHGDCQAEHNDLLLPESKTLNEYKSFKSYLVIIVEIAAFKESFEKNEEKFKKIYGFTMRKVGHNSSTEVIHF